MGEWIAENWWAASTALVVFTAFVVRVEMMARANAKNVEELWTHVNGLHKKIGNGRPGPK